MNSNSNRVYDAALVKDLTKAEFEILLQRCVQLAGKKYNLKRFNCYDYVIDVFNALPGIEKLPLSKVKFPFIFGRGGSPCGLYKDLKKLSLPGSSWASSIHFGLFRSPGDVDSQNLATVH